MPSVLVTVPDEEGLKRLLLMVYEAGWTFQKALPVGEPLPLRAVKSPQSLKSTVEAVKARTLELNVPGPDGRPPTSMRIAAQLRREFPEWRGSPGLVRAVRRWITTPEEPEAPKPPKEEAAVVRVRPGRRVAWDEKSRATAKAAPKRKAGRKA